MKAKRSKTARVYPAESDPRQVNGVDTNDFTRQFRREMSRLAAVVIAGDTTDGLAREFGPWVRGADGRWERRR